MLRLFPKGLTSTYRMNTLPWRKSSPSNSRSTNTHERCKYTWYALLRLQKEE